jgi:hypothetical protein
LADALKAVAEGDRRAGSSLVQAVGASAPDDLTWQISGVLLLGGLLGAPDAALAVRHAREAHDPDRCRELIAPGQILRA